MNRWKENLGTKKRTGDGAARWARRIFCAFLIVIGCLVLADGVGDAVRRAENRGFQSEGNVEQKLSGKSDSFRSLKMSECRRHRLDSHSRYSHRRTDCPDNRQ